VEAGLACVRARAPRARGGQLPQGLIKIFFSRRKRLKNKAFLHCRLRVVEAQFGGVLQKRAYVGKRGSRLVGAVSPIATAAKLHRKDTLLGKKLIIAEKPSVAENIAKALDSKPTAAPHTPKYFELRDYVIASAAGHLAQLDCPEEFMPAVWSIDTLPILPPRFDVCPIEESRPFLDLITTLVKRPDITGIINACDAGREGELIFRLIMQQTNAKQPTERLWLQSLTPESIRESLNNLRSEEQMRPLADAAYCRSEADWTVGINGSRAVSVYMTGGVNAHRRPMSVGRVQTPTLAMLVERESMITSHMPRQAFDIRGEFAASPESDSRYTAQWIDEQYSKDETEVERAHRLSARLGLTLPDVAAQLDPQFGTLADDDRHAKALWHHEIAQAIAAKCRDKHCVVEEEVKLRRENPPGLFNLTTLQAVANSRFGFSAKTTERLAQSLYFTAQVLTYPRVVEQHLPENDVAKTQAMLQTLDGTYAPLATKILANGWADRRKDIFDNAKLKDHHAIVPTGMQPSDLSEPQRKIFDLVTRRTLAAFFPAREYRVTTRLTRCEGELFKCEGRVLVSAGWREVYGSEGDAAAGDGARSLCAIDTSQPVVATNMLLDTRKTKPPARYTDASLLKSMEGAGKNIEDEDLRSALQGAGLGTPATRAEIIETIIHQKYVRRQQRELVVTGKGLQLIQLLKDVGVSELIRPDLTGEWEYNLQQMQDGEFARPEFMAQINSFTQRFVDAFRDESERANGATLRAPCPKCGGVLRVQPRRVNCECGYAFPRIIKQRLFTVSELETLMATRSVGPLHNFIDKNGRPYSASLVLGEGEQLDWVFGNKTEVDLTELQPLGKCCCCGGDVVDDGQKYVCRNSSSTSTPACPFRVRKVIAGREIDETELQQVLTDGKTDQLKGFISKKNGRHFSAFLVLKPDNSDVQFEFTQKQNTKEEQK